jgi:serine/threonine protein kinase
MIEYQTMMLLGSGAYGRVTKIKANDKYFALKETELPEYPKEIEVIIACVREEAMNLIHSHIVERQWSRFFNNKFQICMEMGTPVFNADPRRIIHDIVQALYFMHSKGFIHRDVKPANIVQVGNVYKLIDFGLTCRGDCNRVLTGYMISRWFRPPELLKSEGDLKYDGRVDMYSLGLTAYFLHHGKPLFYGETPELLQMYRNYKPSGLYKHMICDYEERSTAKQLLEYYGVTPIEGTESKLQKRSGNIETFTNMLLGGYDQTALEYGYKGIYNEL